MTEMDLVKQILIESSIENLRLFRNNVGMCQSVDGRFIRYGVGGVGGSDLIGLTPVVIKPEHVGRTLSVFTAIEVKVGKGRLTKEQAQFLAFVQDMGGVAAIGRDMDSVMDAVNMMRGV